MADYKYKPSIVIDDLVSGLKNLKQEAVSAEKVISMIGNRGNLNKLLTTFLQMSNVIEGLTADSDQLKASLGGQLKGGYLKNLDDTFGRLSELINKTRGLGENVLNIDLRKSDAKAQLKSLAKQIDVELDTLGMNKIDFKLFNEASLKDQRDMLIKHINQIGSEITVSVGKIDTSNISGLGNGIADGFDEAGKKIKDSGQKFNAEVQAQIDELEQQNKKLIDAKKKLQKTQDVVIRASKNERDSIPTQLFATQEELKSENVIATIDALTTEYDRLTNSMRHADTSAVEYYENLNRAAEILLKLKSISVTAKSGTDLRQFLLDSDKYDTLAKYSGTMLTGLRDKMSKKVGGIDQLDDIISSNNKRIENIKDLAKFTDPVERHLREIVSLANDLNNPDLNTQEYDALIDKIERLKQEFVELYNVKDQGDLRMLESLGEDDIEDDKAIKHFKDIIQLIDSTPSGGVVASQVEQVGQYAVSATEYINSMALAIRNLFSVASKNSEIEYKILINGQEIDARAGQIGATSRKTTAEAYLANLQSDTVVDAHSHQGLSANIDVADLSNAITRQYSGVAKLSAIIGDKEILTLDLAKVKAEDAYKALFKVNTSLILSHFIKSTTL